MIILNFSNLKYKLWPFILPIIVIVVWFIVGDVLRIFPDYMLPSLGDVWNSLVNVVSSGRLLENTISTLVKVFLGIIIASVIAIPLGIFLGVYEKANRFASLIISILRPIPPIAWIPFAILWLGIGLTSSVAVIFLGCFFPMLVAIIDGVKRTDKVLIEAARTFGATDIDILNKIVLPSALPSIVSGIKVGSGIALMCTVSAEMIASSNGLGYMILTASNLFNPGLIVVGMLVIGIIGIAFDVIFTQFENKIFW